MSYLRTMKARWLAVGLFCGSACFVYASTLTVTCTNGTVRLEPCKSDYATGDVVELIPLPDVGYYFLEWTGDVQDGRLVINVTMNSDKQITANFMIWEPPVGIPAPQFGIFESHYICTNKTYDFGIGPQPYRDDGNGPYTHYVDNTSSAAVDTGNPFGNPEKPRLTIPTTLLAGSVVEIHGGPYAYTSSGYTGAAFVQSQGTAANPVYIRGSSAASKAVFSRHLYVRGSYCIVEHFLFIGPLAGGVSVRAPSDHIGVRDTESTGFVGDSLGNMYNTFPSGNDDVDFNDDVVFYRNTIHDSGYPATVSTQLHNGFQISGNSRRIWIVDNVISQVAEDGIHILCYSDSKYLPDCVYVGRNVIHHCTENAIDVKPSRNVIVSQNQLYGFSAISVPPSDGSDGAAICFNYENGAPVGQKIENHFLILNDISDAAIGVRSEYDIYVYGNAFYNLTDSAVRLNGNSIAAAYIIGNTMYNSRLGIYHSRGAAFYAYNNLIADQSKGHVQYQTTGTREIRNNVFWASDKLAHLWVGGSGAYEIAGLPKWPLGAGAGDCYEGENSFINTNVSSGDFLKPANTSMAVDKGRGDLRVHEMLSAFDAKYDLSIRVDKTRITRPQNSAWDIGAYEYLPSAKRPASPSGLRRK
jgi:hypothetical protein